MQNIGIIVQSLRGGGAERAVANLSRDLSEHYNVYLILFEVDNIAYPYKGTIIDVGIAASTNKLGQIYNLYRRYRIIKRLKRQYHIDLTISFMPKANLYNVLTKTRDVVFISIRNTMSQIPLSRLDKYIIKWCGKRSDMTISLSEGTRQDLIKNFSYAPEKVVTIYNSCDVSWFFRDSPEVDKLIDNYDWSRPTIASVGRLHEQKGQWHLLRALSIVKKEIPKCTLALFGQGELKQPLQDYAQKLGVEENVIFMGYVKDHHKFMSKCKAFVFSSIYEGLGNVLLEALACGMPVISADCPCGPGEILGGTTEGDKEHICEAKYGLLIPPFTSTPFIINDLNFEKSDFLLAEAIIKVLTDSDYSQSLSLRSKERSAFFAPDSIKGQWIKLISNYI